MAVIKMRSKWVIWKDVVFSLFLRELKSKFNDKFGVTWSVIYPLSFIIVLTFLRGSMDGGETHSMPTFFFMGYGILLIRFFIETMMSVSNSIKSNKPLFAFRQLQPISAFLAVAILEYIARAIVLISIFIIAYFLEIEIKVNNFLGVLFVFTQIWVLAFSLGVIIAIGECFIPEIKKLKTMLFRPLIFVSGAFFSLQDIPREFWGYFTWNPLLHAIECTRFYAYETYGVIGISHNYLNYTVISFFILALCIYHATWKSAIGR